MFEISRYQLELFSLSEKERNIVFCPPFGLQLLCSFFAPLDRRDEIVAEKQKMVDCFFFNLGEQQVNVCCRNPNSQRATISYFGLKGN